MRFLLLTLSNYFVEGIAREGVTSLCQSYYQVGYLENIESSCLVKGPSNNDDCQDTFTFGMASYANLRILTSPHLINSTNDLEVSEMIH